MNWSLQPHWNSAISVTGTVTTTAPTYGTTTEIPTSNASKAALDMGQHLIRRDRLGVPQSARDVFALLARAGRIEQELAAGLQRMVGFRNIAVHDYQSLQLPITVAIIEKHLDEFLQYSKALLLHDAV